MTTLIDISRPLSSSTPVWPGDSPVALSWNSRVSAGDPVNIASLTTGLHAGTHVDAPRHLSDDGAPVSEMPLDIFVGPAWVVDVRGRESITARDLGPAMTPAAGATRVLFRTGAWEATEGFPVSFAALTPEAVAVLIERAIRLVGTDAPSVDPFESVDLPAHRLLLTAGIPILENLHLSGVRAGPYELIALPLKLSESDASPVRAALRRL